MAIQKAKKISGNIKVPGDKSISHRCVMFGALAKGLTEATGFLQGADCLSTISCFQKLGVLIENTGDKIRIHGNGLYGLKAPSGYLDTGNSGTTTRLISGILAGQPFTTRVNGDASIQKRPMKRVFTPLSQMGAVFVSERDNGCAPFRVHGGDLRGITYRSPVASAQVKSALLLAGLYADGETVVIEPAASRNHTELMLGGFGAHIKSEKNKASILPGSELKGQNIAVPGDISSAAYFIAAALILPNSELFIENVGINPTRDGILRAAKAMGGNISYENERIVSGEPVADLLVKSSSLHGTEISGDIIPALIDEIPVVAVMAAFARGTTRIKDAAELKVKESDRIASVTENLAAMGADVTAAEDGMIINGGKTLHGTKIHAHMDHRVAMSFAVAGLAAEGETTFDDASCVNISYPAFFSDLKRLCV